MSELDAGAAVAAAEPVVTTQEPVSIESTMASVYDKAFPNERVNRAESGKFESKTPAEAAIEAPADSKITQEPTVVPSEPARPAIARPQSWSADHDEWWSSLPPEKQEYLAKRESEAHQKITQLGTTAKQAEQYRAIIDRYGHVLNGADPFQEVENLLYTKAELLKNPAQSLKWLADQLNVDLSQFVRTATGEQPAENETTRALQQELAQLRRELGETRNHLTARERAETQSQQNSLQKLVEDFAADKKDYWSDIEADVFEQVAAIRAVDKDSDPKTVLEKAHQRAIKLNETVSNRLNEAKRKEEAAKKTAEDKRKADEAKKHAALNVKSSSGQSPKPAKQDMRTEMSDIYDRLAG